MKVSTLIKHLQKLPQNLEVYTADHDHSDYEVSSLAGMALLVDQSKMSPDEIKRHNRTKLESDELANLPKKYVVIRP